MSGVLGVDVGGTFTDFAHWDGARLITAKEPSTPHDQSVGVIGGAVRLPETTTFLHGTTVATNALLERRGAKTALVTSEGFGDVIEIGRQDRPALYDSFADRPEPLVSAPLRFEVPRDRSAWAPAAALAAAESVAVALLYGYEMPEAEQLLAKAIRAVVAPTVPISISSRVVPEFREYERTVTTVINAYLAPEAERYLDGLVAGCRHAGLPDDVLVMRSSGGLAPIDECSRLPASILLSGPAGGVTAAAALGLAAGRDRLISFDMGGTSTDVCRIDGGHPEVSYEREIAGYPCRLPAVAVHTVGAGGGSVAWRDAGNALRVGPRSSGAQPGPAAYGSGGLEPAVTDANVVLGRFGSGRLAGDVQLRSDLARAAVTRLGGELGLDPVATALGIAAVVEEVMAGAIRKVSLEEGADPRAATLIAFGGAGGLHATALARRLDMDSVLVPLHAGVFSALGLLVSPPRFDAAQSRLLRETDERALDALVDEVRGRAAGQFAADVGGATVSVESRADVRYAGQSHEVTVPYTPGDTWEVLATRFHDAHRTRNGFARPDAPIEVVTVRGEAVGDPALRFADIPVPEPTGELLAGETAVVTGDGVVTASIVWRPALAPGDEVTGPAIVREPEATTFLGAGERARVHDTGALEIEW
jgi:N-methylhydantoinase A